MWIRAGEKTTHALELNSGEPVITWRVTSMAWLEKLLSTFFSSPASTVDEWNGSNFQTIRLGDNVRKLTASIKMEQSLICWNFGLHIHFGNHFVYSWAIQYFSQCLWVQYKTNGMWQRHSTHTKWAYNTSTCMSYIVVVNNSLKTGHEFLFAAAPSCWVSRWYHRFLNITLHATTGVYIQHLELQEGVTLGKELSRNSFMDLEDKDTIAVVSYPWSKLCLG